MKDDKADIASEYLAKVICICNGIAPVEPRDGGANWFMFYNDADKMVKALRERGFEFEELEKQHERVQQDRKHKTRIK